MTPVSFDPESLLISPSILKSIKKSFLRELEESSRGIHTSIPYLKHSLPTPKAWHNIREGDLFQVMTIGGSIYKKALIKKQDDSFIILEEQQETIPVFSTDRVFLDFIQKRLNPSISYLALNFAYPLKPVIHNGLLDGMLLHGTKFSAFDGFEEKTVGKSVEEFILKKVNRTIQVTVANDTVCLFLADTTKSNFETNVVGIIGTGTNYAFGMDDYVISLESGAFAGFHPTASGTIIDLQSVNPGKQLIEKEISGAYLFQHFNVITQHHNLGFPLLSSTEELSKLAEDDTNLASFLAQIILERSASFAACQIAGIVEFKQKTTNGPFTFIMEGTLFWKGYRYKTYIEKFLQVLGAMDKIIFSPVDHRSIKGGIKLLMPLR